jgi:hypothetical protein
LFFLFNSGASNSLILRNESGASQINNRIWAPLGDLYIFPGTGVCMWYVAFKLRWVPVCWGAGVP